VDLLQEPRVESGYAVDFLGIQPAAVGLGHDQQPLGRRPRQRRPERVAVARGIAGAGERHLVEPGQPVIQR